MTDGQKVHYACGMNSLTTIRAIIDLWPSRAALADDISVPGDRVSAAQVHKWAERGTIPAPFHARLLRAAHHRGFVLTAELIVAAHDQRSSSEDAA